MKQHLLFIIVTIIFFSCGKNHDDSPHPVLSPTRTALMAQTWIQDSIGSLAPGYNNVIYQSPRLTFRYGLDKYYTGDETGQQYDSFHYELEEPNKVYYWSESQVKDTSVYFMIDTINDTSLITSFPTNPKVYEWCHAK